VTQFVMKITTNEIRNQIFQANMKLGGMTIVPDYDKLNAAKDDPGNEKIKDIILATNQQVANNKLALSGIKVKNVNDEIKKCECEGKITNAGGRSIPITYIAQYTDSERIRIEVYGLK
ncbi:MAG: hypothetical protein Q8R42_05555, partial [Desulfocapsaceae bacterium]|nr:hypothetical protein [Desulfocapsaceae bacterium]